MGKRGSVAGHVPGADKLHLVETLTATCDEVLARCLSDPDTAGSEATAALKTLTALEPECRAAFMMHRFLDLDYGVIAQNLGISVAAVESHMAWALLQISADIEASRAWQEET